MNNIIIRQGYASNPMIRFKFLEQFNLRSYYDQKSPLVIFGCYTYDDVLLMQNHKSHVFVVWMGKDTLEADLKSVQAPHIYHATWISNIKTYLEGKGINCLLLKMPVKERPYPNPVRLGNSVYAYLQKTKPEYHGGNIVNSLRIKHPILIGDHSVSREAWYAGINNVYYSKTFIGLALSEYAGGAMSILEMGVRGIKVVTNVLSMPHCIPWKDVQDVENAIEEESKNIGNINHDLIKEVYDSLIDCANGFDLNQLLL